MTGTDGESRSVEPDGAASRRTDQPPGLGGPIGELVRRQSARLAVSQSFRKRLGAEAEPRRRWRRFEISKATSGFASATQYPDGERRCAYEAHRPPALRWHRLGPSSSPQPDVEFLPDPRWTPKGSARPPLQFPYPLGVMTHQLGKV